MPTFFMASKSLVMPDLDTCPLIQCHHVRALAWLGGFLKPDSNTDELVLLSCPHPLKKQHEITNIKKVVFFIIYFLFIIFEVEILTGPNNPAGNNSSVAF